MRTLAKDYGAETYTSDEITKEILSTINNKVEELYDILCEIKDIEVYMEEAIDNSNPQTVLKLYNVDRMSREYDLQLTGILDVQIQDTLVKVTFYNKMNQQDVAYAEFINGEMGMEDGIPTPIQLKEFDIRDIENLISTIEDEYSK